MTEEMKKALRDELQTFKDNLPEYATADDMDNRLKTIEDKLDDPDMKESLNEVKAAVEEHKTVLEKQGLEINKVKTKVEDEKKTLRDVLKEKLHTDDAYKDIPNGKIIKFEVDKDILKTDVTRASVGSHTLAMRLTDVGQLATQRNVIRPLFRTRAVGPNSNGVVRYVDQATVTRNADWKAEAAQKPESAITWLESYLNIQKIADTIPVTMEALEDVDFIEGEIRNLLLKNLELKVDADLFSGSGVAPIISGIYTYADTYVPVAAGIANASIYDLLIKVHEDITGTTQYMPNYALMNIADINEMRLSKDTNGNYILPPFASKDGGMVGGMTVIPSNSVTANTMLVGDFDYAELFTLGSLSLDVGRIDKQFIENMVTLRAEERMGLLVRGAHTDAFRKVTDIDAALVTIGS